MFHAHKTEFAEKGWMGLFLVKDPTSSVPISNETLIRNNVIMNDYPQGLSLDQKRGGDI
jgi:hypothetical protein